jgi:hypothetical protein
MKRIRKIFVDESEIAAAEFIPGQGPVSFGLSSTPAKIRMQLKAGGVIEINENEKQFSEYLTLFQEDEE